MTEKKALVAMSGGVDSSTAAYLMKEAGHPTSGVIMRLFDTGSDSIEAARKVASDLGIELSVLDMRDAFRKNVIDHFVADYAGGRTPNPCVRCNRVLKFGALYDAAVRTGGSTLLVTGHYAVIEKNAASGRYLLRKAADRSKDQSYFLCMLTQEQLSRSYFPLGTMTKQEIRAIAGSAGITTAHRKDSQDICFIPDGDYASFITGYTGQTFPHGDFTDAAGNVLGEHKGIIHYTIGQRKGLGIALGKPAYVCSIDAAGGRVVLGDNADLFTRELTASGFNWISTAPPQTDIRALARIRYRHKESAARVIPLAADKVKIIFDEPQRAITPGQTVAVYDGDHVLGGGTID